ncbi:HAD family phosphatase [Streptomyces sp. WAC05374]|uniref:HAD family hydrolase n=1 Tax=Streptomyces sp. WAC05374 TaxID=2487420 RepID=UPI000F86F47E|nr:HAD hydrolase-like protein [Streptomyces sp. WAC05374]RST17099.1 HAD family phosphatase [Streptomyces sp. WAC05374]TDF47343.1 HAD family phosphatase [Streptomyces sp. WAC05374]TDF57601.1 HAD family phosphatase [Streptomyces sp. WAC05374]TDF61706.1 HAD family phosphatase [Streptomyces sp. WAC05374]
MCDDDLIDVLGGTEHVLFGFEGTLLRAGATAWPTPYADPLVRTLAAVGTGLVVVTGTPREVVARYLAARGLSGCFGPHVHAGAGDALASLDAAPATCLMIGATPADLAAAREAGVPFLGYGRAERTAELLRAAGADRVVPSLEPVLAAVREAAHRSARTHTEQRA